MVKMNDTPTPRTDAIIAKHDHILQYTDLLNYCKDMTANSVQLERELADMTKQRDHYKAACDQYSEDEMLCKLQEVTKQRDALAFSIRFALANSLADSKSETVLRRALAATKRGQHE
jgi:hypothetical protein